MLILAVLFLTGVAALPTTGPVVVVPPGSNVTMTIEGGMPPTIMTGGFPGGETLYRRFEFQFLDFQMNQTAPIATNLVQNLEIYTNLTFGPHMGFPNGENWTESETGTFTSDIPTSIQGYTQLFNGLYNGGTENKINIDRTLTADTCGIIYDKGYMDVWVRPINAAVAGAFREGYYTCFYNFNFPPTMPIVHEGESQWSTIFQCNSGSLNNYSFRLWYQFRYYNIESKVCQAGNFHSN